MKAERVLVIGVLCMGLLGASLYGAPAYEAHQGCMGICFHPSPLPPLLVKHLRLSPDEGVLIVNVQVDSPADKAGLERDDIIVRLGDAAVTDREAFVDAVREAGAGNQITLEVIHLGERKTVKLTLMSIEKMANRTEWKYPPEPEPVESWQPGRMWFMQPGDEKWSEVPWNELFRAPGHEQDVTKLFKEIYTFRQRQDGKSYTITIEGDPADEEAWITVRSGSTEYKVMAKDIDELPTEYREPVRDSLRRAKEQSHQRGVLKLPSVPRLPNLKRQDLFEDLRKIRPPAGEQKEDGKMLEDIQKQMRQLREEIEKLQKNQKEMSERLRESQKADEGNGV